MHRLVLNHVSPQDVAHMVVVYVSCITVVASLHIIVYAGTTGPNFS